MNRRTLLKQIGTIAVAASLAPACVRDTKKVSVALSNLDVDGDDEELLASIAETIIPEGKEPGGRKVRAHLYAFVMVNDCEDAESKETFTKGLKTFDAECKAVAGTKFSNSDANHKLEILKTLETENSAFSADVKKFYGKAKHYIVEGYLGSEYYLTKVKPYVLVPGPDFRGCVPVANLS
jgi:hypothetical protein